MPNLLIVGETNNGKTAMLSRFVRQHPPRESDGGEVASGIPVIAMEAPPVPDERRFYAEILRQVFAPFRASKPVGQLQYEVLRLLATVEVKLLIIDEIQHVLAGPLLKQRQFLNVIKHLGNELQIPIVAAGTQDAFNAIQTDPQLANRFEPAVLRRWTMGEDYLRLLVSSRLRSHSSSRRRRRSHLVALAYGHLALRGDLHNDSRDSAEARSAHVLFGVYAGTLALHPELDRIIDIIEADDWRLFST